MTRSQMVQLSVYIRMKQICLEYQRDCQLSDRRLSSDWRLKNRFPKTYEIQYLKLKYCTCSWGGMQISASAELRFHRLYKDFSQGLMMVSPMKDYQVDTHNVILHLSSFELFG